MNFEPEKSSKMSKTKRHRSTMKNRKNSLRKSRSPQKLNSTDIKQRHQSISYMQQDEAIELERDESRKFLEIADHNTEINDNDL